MAIRIKVFLIWCVARVGCWTTRDRRRAHPLVILLGEDSLTCACRSMSGQYISWRDRPWLVNVPTTVPVPGRPFRDGGNSRVKFRSHYYIFGQPALVEPLNLWICKIKHRWHKSQPIHHWISAGGELRAYDAGMSSCDRTCLRCNKHQRLDDCEAVSENSDIGSGIFSALQQRVFIEPSPPAGTRRIKA